MANRKLRNSPLENMRKSLLRCSEKFQRKHPSLQSFFCGKEGCWTTTTSAAAELLGATAAKVHEIADLEDYRRFLIEQRRFAVKHHGLASSSARIVA